MDVKIKNDEIIIKMPLQPPKLSASGKSMVVATSRGKQLTGSKVQGKSVFVVANVFTEVEKVAASEPEQSNAKRQRRKS
jgi:hypothetical protein